MADNRSNIKRYLAKLAELLKYQGLIGNFTSQQASDVYTSVSNMLNERKYRRGWSTPGGGTFGQHEYYSYTDADMETLALPYYKEIMVDYGSDADWELLKQSQEQEFQKYKEQKQNEQKKLIREKASIAADTRRFIPDYEKYLKGAGLDDKDIEQRVMNARAMIEIGVPLQDLPDFDSTQEYIQSKQQQERQVGRENVERANAEEEREQTLKGLETMPSRAALAPPPQTRDLEMVNPVQPWGEEWSRRMAATDENAPKDWIERWKLSRQMGTAPLGQYDPTIRPDWNERTGWPGPKAPNWITKFVPGSQLDRPTAYFDETGNIVKMKMTSPNWQTLQETPPSIRAGLESYAGWTGQSWEDMVWKAQKDEQERLDRESRMLPDTPIGARRTSWRPAQQRANRW